MVVVMAVCTRPQPVRGMQPWRNRVISTTTTAFAGDVSERIVDKEIVAEFGGGRTQTLQLVRGGTVVCSVEGGGSFRGCVGGTQTSAWLELRSTEPIRFVVQHDDGLHATLVPNRRCTGYELPAHASCRQVFERSCPADDCTYTTAVSHTAGSGRLILNATRDGHADRGVMMNVDSPMGSTTGDDGRAELALTPGVHAASIVESFIGIVDEPFVSGPLEDVTVDLDVRCNCCAF